MRLLDFVEQHYRVRCALHALGKLSALFVAYVSRRRTDQLRNRVLLHELGHIEADQSLLDAEHELRERATSVFPTPVGPRNRNEPIGRFGLFRPARLRRIARARAVIALSCEIIRLWSSSSMSSSL